MWWIENVKIFKELQDEKQIGSVERSNSNGQTGTAF